MAPRSGNRKTWRKTDTETHKGKSDFAVTDPKGPRPITTPFSPTARWARAVRYGPRSAVATVVTNAEFAQSYIIQPTISRRSPRGRRGASTLLIESVPA